MMPQTSATRSDRGRVLRLALVVWSFGYLLVAIAMTMQQRSGFALALMSQAPLLVLGVSATLVIDVVQRRVSARWNALRWPGLAGLIVVGGLMMTVVDLLYLNAIGRLLAPSWLTWAVITWQRFFVLVILYTWTVSLAATLVWASDQDLRAKAAATRAAAAEAATRRAETAALRLQLNPHFLVNSLNGVSALIATGRSAQAEEMVARLAEFLRASLSVDPSELASLASEIATIQAYLDVEAARFDHRLAVRIDTPAELATARLPQFILQPLVENAVRHGLQGGGVGAIGVVARAVADRLEIQIDNTGDEHDPCPGSGVGLKNTVQRLHLVYGDSAVLEAGPRPGGYRVRLSLPLDHAGPA